MKPTTLRLSLRTLVLTVVALGLMPSAADAHERWVKHALLSEFDRTLFETVCFTNVATLIGCLALALVPPTPLGTHANQMAPSASSARALGRLEPRGGGDHLRPGSPAARLRGASS